MAKNKNARQFYTVRERSSLLFGKKHFNKSFGQIAQEDFDYILWFVRNIKIKLKISNEFAKKLEEKYNVNIVEVRKRTQLPYVVI